MPFTFNKENLLQFKKKLEQYDSKESLLIPVLSMAQRQAGYISDDVVKYISQLLQLPEARIVEVISFYSMYRTSPPKKTHVQFCNNLTCKMKNMDALRDYACRRAEEISRIHGTDEIEISEVECLGSCDTAPVAMINDARYEENLTKERLEALLTGAGA